MKITKAHPCTKTGNPKQREAQCAAVLAAWMKMKHFEKAACGISRKESTWRISLFY